MLKPGGQLLFCEHARTDGWRGSLQRGLNGAWSGLFGGCNLTRDPVSAIEDAGFTTDDVVVERFSLPRVMLGMHYSGEARARRENADGLAPAKREEEGAG